MTDIRDPALAAFSDDELRRELRLRDDERAGRFRDSLGPCPECGAPAQSFESEVVETFRSAPGWRGWPALPPPEYEQIDGHRYAIRITCKNGHVVEREEVKFREAATGPTS